VRYRSTLAYDGTAYQGFQRQAHGIPTIQATVEHAIQSVTQQQVHLHGAGRTDSGVHATGQVIAFDVDWRHDDETLLRAINANLPDDIALQDMCQQEGFHPRFDAKARRYCYTIFHTAQRQPLLARYGWWVRQGLDVEKLQRTASLMTGQHDFATFGNPPHGNNTVREIFESSWSIIDEANVVYLRYVVEGTAFLHHMVRRMVGMQVDVGTGRITVEEFKHKFTRADLSLATTMAPSQGLVLEKVRYSDNDN